MTSASVLLPAEIGRVNDHDLKIVWQDGHISEYDSHKLRLACPCAGCVDEMTGRVRVIASGISPDVHPLKVALVGHYAATIHWSDGHHTGIYTFELLRRLCPCALCVPAVAGTCGGGKGAGACGCQSKR